MKRKIFLFSCAAFFAGAVFFSCAHSPPPEHTAVESTPAVSEKPAAPVVIREHGLNTSVFNNLPSEARVYLERLAEAFSARDTAFLLAQGESQFEREVKPLYDDVSYFALLYRTGTYAADSPRLTAEAETSRFAPDTINGIQYLEWEETGPLLEIKARLLSADGDSFPCRIMLVWRLPEPKIEGLFP